MGNKETYIEEKFSRYLIFGKHPDGTVDVVNANTGEIVSEATPEALANNLVNDRNALIAMIVKLSIPLGEDDFTSVF